MRLIEKVWFHNDPAKYWLIPLLLPLTFIFWLLSNFRRIAFECKLLPSTKVSKPVIVVGNIGVGGNGKTPLVLWLIKLCREQGLTPGVISRGYGGKPPAEAYLLTEHSTVDETGDESLMIYQRTNVAICVGKDRVKSANELIGQGCDILITDDGLQHYRLQRDVEFIVIDGKRRFGNERLLPAGPLREGVWRLGTADYVINNGNKPLVNEIPMTLEPGRLVNCVTGEQIDSELLRSQVASVSAIAGIGSPERFFATVRTLGFKISHQHGFVDHHNYHKDDFVNFSNDIPLLMTEKDAIKCCDFATANWWYVPVEAHLPKIEENLLAKRLKQLAENS